MGLRGIEIWGFAKFGGTFFGVVPGIRIVKFGGLYYVGVSLYWGPPFVDGCRRFIAISFGHGTKGIKTTNQILVDSVSFNRCGISNSDPLKLDLGWRPFTGKPEHPRYELQSKLLVSPVIPPLILP